MDSKQLETKKKTTTTVRRFATAFACCVNAGSISIFTTFSGTSCCKQSQMDQVRITYSEALEKANRRSLSEHLEGLTFQKYGVLGTPKTKVEIWRNAISLDPGRNLRRANLKAAEHWFELTLKGITRGLYERRECKLLNIKTVNISKDSGRQTRTDHMDAKDLQNKRLVQELERYEANWLHQVRSVVLVWLPNLTVSAKA